MPSMVPAVGRRLMEPLAQIRHLAGVGPLAADATRNGRVWGEVRGLPVIRYSLTGADVARLRRGIELSMQMLIAGGARRLYPGVVGLEGLDARDAVDRFRKMDLSASDLALVSYHPLGTCEMGTDPQDERGRAGPPVPRRAGAVRGRRKHRAWAHRGQPAAHHHGAGDTRG